MFSTHIVLVGVFYLQLDIIQHHGVAVNRLSMSTTTAVQLQHLLLFLSLAKQKVSFPIQMKFYISRSSLSLVVTDIVCDVNNTSSNLYVRAKILVSLRTED